MRFRSSKAHYGSLNFSEPARVAGFRWDLAGLALATLAGGLGLALLAEADAPLPSAHVEQAAAPAPAWTQINRPFELYGLEVSEVAKLSRTYEARRHVTGGGRQDILTFGSLKSGSAYFRLVLYRMGDEDAQNVPFFVELARRAADGGLAITKSQSPVPLATRFGDVEVADLSLASAEGAALPCLGFRMDAKTLPWRMTGFACGGGMPLPRPELQCIFDRLDLHSAGDDRALAKFFADAELRRNPACAGTRLTPASAHAAWLDEKEAPPPLRLSKH
ncbi:hypothetical protein [Methyloferula stellata]|uniref:hypothetical protein n=1 Tax=Methyloferula stellata TaxID=876270 RepID=UPI0012679854|nr:hypothetical protein [Methyloferula stellata]